MTHLTTDPYKGTRDFYPNDMAVQRYIFDTWAKTAEVFGYERYDASILEPADLYKSKGAENEELVNEQTYTFTDRGEREVTLRPEMTPTVARMVAAKRRELAFPLRWYAIPNLFRYERPQRGRLREHWQLNCDLFGVPDISGDVELILLAHNVLTAFGAKSDMFEIRVNSRKLLEKQLTDKLKSPELLGEYLRLLDKKEKIGRTEFTAAAKKLLKTGGTVHLVMDDEVSEVINALGALGIQNIRFDESLTRGFDYYTGIVFEIFDTSKKNNRSLIGGGRYDNLTSLFGGEPITGVGFGIGDVTMRDFLETHGLLKGKVKSPVPRITILPLETSFNVDAHKIAEQFRTQGISVSVDLSDKKLGKKIGTASDKGVRYILPLGEDELKSKSFTLKELANKHEIQGSLQDLIEAVNKENINA